MDPRILLRFVDCLLFAFADAPNSVIASIKTRALLKLTIVLSFIDTLFFQKKSAGGLSFLLYKFRCL